MPDRKVYSSPDGRVEVVWRDGVLFSVAKLFVDQRLVDERIHLGGQFPGNLYDLYLDGPGVNITLHLRQTWTSTKAVGCTINGTYAQYDKSDSDTVDDISAIHSEEDVDYACKILGLSRESVTREKLDSAYRASVKKYHPDVYERSDIPQHLKDLAQERFEQTVDAYKFLKEYLD